MRQAMVKREDRAHLRKGVGIVIRRRDKWYLRMWWGVGLKEC